MKNILIITILVLSLLVSACDFDPIVWDDVDDYSELEYSPSLNVTCKGNDCVYTSCEVGKGCTETKVP